MSSCVRLKHGTDTDRASDTVSVGCSRQPRAGYSRRQALTVAEVGRPGPPGLWPQASMARSPSERAWQTKDWRGSWKRKRIYGANGKLGSYEREIFVNKQVAEQSVLHNRAAPRP
jgi:hypothetical protein